jgi:hypothetical protein
MNKKKIIRYILLALLVFLILAQFKRVDNENPPITEGQDFLVMNQTDPAMAQLIRGACYDCHSHETDHPWYTEVAPISWWIKGHIDHGRESLNFSTWGNYKAKKQKHKLEECASRTEATEMPLLTYIILHSEARISKEERADMVQYFSDLSQ